MERNDRDSVWRRQADEGSEDTSSSSSDDDIDEVVTAGLLLSEHMLNHRPKVAAKRGWGGSRPGRAPNKKRRRLLYAQLLFDDYWGPDPVYDANHFRRTFRMPRALFDEIHERVTQVDEYFLQKKDALGVPGFTSLQKVVCAVRMLTSGDSAHELDDKFRLAESTAIENLHRFCNAIIGIYGDEVIRSPSVDDLNHLLDEGWKSGWPGCIGSLDCMHVKWKNCPSAWAGMFTGKEHEPTVVIEAIADHDCRIWHFFCGCPGSLNDLNVLDRSPVLNSQITGEMPNVLYSVGQNEYSIPYYLVDGIYPDFHCFMSTISNPSSRAQKLFATKQEAKRKDIERAFGILQHRFHILTIPMKLWHRDALCVVVKTCVILHNLIIDFERKHSIDSTYIEGFEYVPEHPFVVVPAKDEELSADAKLVNMARIHNRHMHARLKADLVEHLWSTFGGADDSI